MSLRNFAAAFSRLLFCCCILLPTAVAIFNHSSGERVWELDRSEPKQVRPNNKRRGEGPGDSWSSTWYHLYMTTPTFPLVEDTWKECPITRPPAVTARVTCSDQSAQLFSLRVQQKRKIINDELLTPFDSETRLHAPHAHTHIHTYGIHRHTGSTGRSRATSRLTFPSLSRILPSFCCAPRRRCCFSWPISAHGRAGQAQGHPSRSCALWFTITDLHSSSSSGGCCNVVVGAKKIVCQVEWSEGPLFSFRKI